MSTRFRAAVVRPEVERSTVNLSLTKNLLPKPKNQALLTLTA